MIGILPYILIFANFAFFCISELFPGVITYKQLAVVLAFVSVSIVFLNIRKSIKANKALIVASFVLLIICVCIFLTGDLFYRNALFGKDIYNGEVLAVVGQTTPLVIIALLFAEKETLLSKTKRLAPYIAIVFTLVSLSSALHPANFTSGGYALDDNGMNYQNISYMAAYASSFTFFYLLNRHNCSFGRLLDSNLAAIIMIVTLFINFFTVLISGGRGGLICILVQLVVFIFVLLVLKKQPLLKVVPITFLSILIVLFVLSVVQNAHVDSSGFDRILRFLNERDDAGRGIIRRIAYRSIKESPIYGHGLGSSMFIIGQGSGGQHIHCHNFILDAMVETGILGTLFFVGVLVKTIKNLAIIVKRDITEYLWLVIFLDGFVMSMFSGYYLAHLPIAWSIGFSLSRIKHSVVVKKR